MSKDMGAPQADGLAGAEAPEPHSRLGPTGGIPSAADLVNLLAPIVSGGASSCLNGTPMIPLHRNTVAAILMHMEIMDVRAAPKAISGFPIPGWRLQRVEYDNGHKENTAPGWIVSLHSEADNPFEARSRYRCVMTRSLIGPLEAWDEAIQIALRENELSASAIEARQGQDAQRLDAEHESAVGNAETPKTSRETQP